MSPHLNDLHRVWPDAGMLEQLRELAFKRRLIASDRIMGQMGSREIAVSRCGFALVRQCARKVVLMGRPALRLH